MSHASQHTDLDSPAGNGAGRAAPGEGIDRKIEKKFFTPKRAALIAAGVVAAALLIYGVVEAATGGQKLNVEREKVTISSVQRGPFQEFVPVTGSIIPRKTVYLDAVEGGRIEEVFAQEGSMVQEGEPLLRLSNNDLQMRLLGNETQLSEQVSRLQSMRFQMEQNRLSLQQQLSEMDYQIRRLEREEARQRQLHEKGFIADQEYEATADELAYLRERRELTRRAYRQDSLAQANQLQQLQAALSRMRQRFGSLQETLDNLTVRAPTHGQLTSLDAEVGQIIGSGTRFGKVDVLDSYKVQAQIDEFYIERVRRGQRATTQPIGGTERALEVTRVYPEVEDGQFKVDLAFTEEEPSGLRRGQTIRFRLELSDPEPALLLERGGFYQSTGGNWAYVVEGGEAVRRPIQLGRQNPEQFEVLEGLRPGDRVVTSSYETFGEADRLILE